MDVSIYMNENNYVCVNGNKHIFINFDKKDLNFIETGGVRRDAMRTFHIYITSYRSANKYLQMFVRKYGSIAQIVIHFPYPVRMFRSGFDLLLKGLDYAVQINFKNVVYECGSDRNDRVFINITNEHVWVQLPKVPIHIHGNNFKYRLFANEGKMYLSPDWEKNPDQYRVKIMRQFKTLCPRGLYNAFDDEDDVWDYITRKCLKEVDDVVPLDSQQDVASAQ